MSIQSLGRIGLINFSRQLSKRLYIIGKPNMELFLSGKNIGVESYWQDRPALKSMTFTKTHLQSLMRWMIPILNQFPLKLFRALA